MKDFNSNELNIGDFVAFLEPNYRHMCQGRVVGFTPKQIRIEFVPYYRQDPKSSRFNQPEMCLRETAYVAKIQQKESEVLVD